MAAVALVPHQIRPEAAALARETVAWLEQLGHEVRIPEDDASATHLTRWAWPTAELAAGLDLAVALGGDGTMLRTVDLVAGADVPVLGVNVGQLGYLTEVEPGALRPCLERFFAGRYEIDRRMALAVDIESAEGGTVRRIALNEAVLEKTLSGHTVRLAMLVDGRPFITTAADGLIVSTPTGSTAYNLSARGPIVSPRLRGLIVTPVSPHALFDRSLVLHDEEVVRVEVLAGRPAALVIDGHEHGVLVPGDSISCRSALHDALFVSFDRRDFFQILKTKFHLADR